MGLSVRDIAARWGISPAYVREVLVEIGAVKPGVQTPRVAETTLERMRDMVDDGCSFHEIARTLGVDRRTITRHFPGHQWTQSQGAVYRNLRKKFGQP